MNKEYLEYLKNNDPIHYCEIMGDPVTGLNSNDSNVGLFLIVMLLIAIGIVIGVYV